MRCLRPQSAFAGVCEQLTHAGTEEPRLERPCTEAPPTVWKGSFDRVSCRAGAPHGTLCAITCDGRYRSAGRGMHCVDGVWKFRPCTRECDGDKSTSGGAAVTSLSVQRAAAERSHRTSLVDDSTAMFATREQAGGILAPWRARTATSRRAKCAASAAAGRCLAASVSELAPPRAQTAHNDVPSRQEWLLHATCGAVVPREARPLPRHLRSAPHRRYVLAKVLARLQRYPGLLREFPSRFRKVSGWTVQG